MKKEKFILNPKASKGSALQAGSRRLGQQLSAAVLASALMGASVFAIDLDVNGTTRVFENTTEEFDDVTLRNDGLITGDGTGTIIADGTYRLRSGTVHQVNLSGTAGVSKTTFGRVILTGENTYTGATTILGGVLQIGDGVTGSLSSATTISGAGILEINLADQGIFSNDVNLVGGVRMIGANLNVVSGNIRGLGVFTQRGTGTTILTGSNSYVGLTRVENGTLQIGDGVSGSISRATLVTVDDGATLNVNLADGGVLSGTGLANHIVNSGLVRGIASGTNTISRRISGSGQFEQAGSGTTILTGSNTYTGGTYIESGTLQIGDGLTSNSTIASSDYVDVSEGATLAIKLADGESFTNAVYSDGTIRSIVESGSNRITNQFTGDGGFVKEGAGTTVFSNSYNTTGQHTYGGLTDIREGTLRTRRSWSLSANSTHNVEAGATLDIGNTNQEVGNLTGDGDVTIRRRGDLYVGYSNEGATFDGVISGRGQVHKEGDGIWTLTGDNTFRRTFNVNEGAVALFGSVASRVHNDALFYGTGYVGRSFINHGAVSGGDIINGKTGTLTIGRNFSQRDDAAYFVGVKSANKHSRLQIGGEANLDGTLYLYRLNDYKAKRSDKLTVLTADEGVYGRFSEFNNDLAKTMLTPKVVYKDNAVVIKFEQEKFAKLKGLTPNQKAVARALDKDSNRKSLNKLFDKLNVLDRDDVPDVLAKLSPEQFAAIFNIGFATAQLQFINIERRLDDVRRGNAAFSTNGLALSNSRGSISVDGAPIVNERDGLSLAGYAGKSVVGKQTVAPIIEESRWSFFATGSGEWADVESTHHARGSDFQTAGVNIGADYRVNNNLVVGITAGYANTTSDLFDGGEVKVNSGRGALYGSWFCDGFYVNALAGGAYNSYDTRRSTFGGKAHGTPDGGEFDALLGGGYDFNFGGFTIGPVGSFQYTYIELGSITESGSDAPLHFPKQHQESLKSLLGLKAAYTFNLCNVAITPEVRAQWQHEYLDSTVAVESSFASSGTAFSVNGPDIGRDGVLIDAGVTAQFNSAFSVFAYWTGDYGRSNYTSNSVNGGFRINF